MSHAFELRFASFLTNRDFDFEYEGDGNNAKKIDFIVQSGKCTFNVELHRFSTSNAKKDNTRTQKQGNIDLIEFDGGQYSDTPGKQNPVLVANLINAQKKAAEKSEKFKIVDRDNEFNILCFDIRAMNSGCVDRDDAVQIFDTNYAKNELRCSVRKNDVYENFKGLFECDNKRCDASKVKEKVHAAFVVFGDSYGDGEFAKENSIIQINQALCTDLNFFTDKVIELFR